MLSLIAVTAFSVIDIFNLFRDANSVLVMAGERQG
jgi:hypothetical protein